MSLNLIELRSPGFVLAEMRTVDNLLKSLIADVGQSQAGNAQFRESLKNFALEWTKFFNDHASGVGGWFTRGLSPVYDKTKEYRHRTQTFQQAFEAAGGRVAIHDSEQRTDRVLPWWAVAGMTAGIIVYALHKAKGASAGALYTRQVVFPARR